MEEKTGFLHRRSTAVLALVIMLVLMTAAVAWGAWKGWKAQSDEVQQTLSSLTSVLQARYEAGNNVLTVAARHLPGSDPAVTSLAEQVKKLKQPIPLEEKAQANARLGQDAQDILTRLAALDSLKRDERDLSYVAQLLPQALEQSAIWADEAAYNTAAAGYNKRLQTTFSGFVAQLLGIRPAQQFIIEKQEGAAL